MSLLFKVFIGWDTNPRFFCLLFVFCVLFLCFCFVSPVTLNTSQDMILELKLVIDVNSIGLLSIKIEKNLFKNIQLYLDVITSLDKNLESPWEWTSRHSMFVEYYFN